MSEALCMVLFGAAANPLAPIGNFSERIARMPPGMAPLPAHPPKKYRLLLFAKPAIRARAFLTPDAALNVIKCIELGKKITDSGVFRRNALCQY
jgi:hypothetical protein